LNFDAGCRNAGLWLPQIPITGHKDMDFQIPTIWLRKLESKLSVVLIHVIKVPVDMKLKIQSVCVGQEQAMIVLWSGSDKNLMLNVWWL